MTLAHRTNNWMPSLLDDMFKNDLLNHGLNNNRKSVAPVNVSESETGFHLEMNVAGFNKEEIEIEVDKDLLTISSVVESNDEETTEQFTRKEFKKESFKRSFNIPETVNQEQIDADYKNGILSIVLPKKEEALPQPKRMISLK
ncbi:MAG: Hsp20/alpha crystallin family protein [Nonlabens sp.]